MRRIGWIASRVRKAAKAHFWVEFVDDVKGDRLNAMADSEDRVVKITKALAEQLTNDELAYVISHEFAHFLADHHQRMVDWLGEKAELMKEDLEERDRRLAEAGRGFCRRLLSQVAWGALDSAALYACAHLQSQKHETEADKRALEIMTRAGFDPCASVSALRKMHGGYLGDRGLFEGFVSTHPSPARRARELETEARELRRRR